MRWIVLAVAALGCGEPELPETIVRPVKTQIATLSGAELRGAFSGVAEAGDQATLSFAAGGTVEAVLVKVGDRVAADQPLARLDATQLRLQVGQSRATVAQAAASLTLARQSMERTEALYVGDNASAAELESARANLDSARASHASALRSLEIALEQLDSAVLVANRDGLVSDVLVTSDENVGAGSPVVVLTPTQRLQVTVAVPGSWVGRVSRGIAATATFAEVDGLAVPATVTEVGVTGTSGSFSVTVELDQQEARIRPGMGADVEISIASTGQTTLELPLSAVSEDAEGKHVWVLRDAEADTATVHRTAVTTGDLTSARVRIEEGVQPGDRVVTAGTSLLYEGRVVRVLP
ncbi:MAG: efflux RND transporter periplasmic adaptor subunit [Myxococcales bacterium]|nr:efflux RND transporter periplasmic adaptor subunit [Myxococcales bacterium]